MKILLFLALGLLLGQNPLHAQYWGPHPGLTKLGQKTKAAAPDKDLLPWMKAVNQARAQANRVYEEEGGDASFRYDYRTPCEELPEGKDAECWTRYQRLYRAMDTNPLVAGLSIRYGVARDMFLLQDDDFDYIRAFFSQPTTQKQFDPAYEPVEIETRPEQQVLVTIGRNHHTRFHFVFHMRNRTVFFYYNDL